jgi:hypothetical protein
MNTMKHCSKRSVRSGALADAPRAQLPPAEGIICPCRMSIGRYMSQNSAQRALIRIKILA